MPLQAAFGWAASRLGFTITMLGVHLAATLALASSGRPASPGRGEVRRRADAR